jgi:hypothetical protein
MANQIHNAGMTFDEILSEEKEAEVTTLYGGDPTIEEAQEAFDKMFEESAEAFDNLFSEVWRKNS